MCIRDSLEGIRAFIPASKLALHYVENPAEYVGQTVDAVVITVDEENGKLVRSCREILQEKLDEQRSEQVNRLSVGGFHILVYHRIAHWLYQHKRFFLARWVSQHGRRRTGIE